MKNHNQILAIIPLSNRQTTVNIDSSEQHTATAENNTSRTQDPLPNYNTVINIKKNEENPPAYHEAVGIHKVCL